MQHYMNTAKLLPSHRWLSIFTLYSPTLLVLDCAREKLIQSCQHGEENEKDNLSLQMKSKPGRETLGCVTQYVYYVYMYSICIYTSISTANYIGSSAKFSLNISETNKQTKNSCALYTQLICLSSLTSILKEMLYEGHVSNTEKG